jgi:alpha-tubulin suppressor-like RCC1 family protein
MRLYRDVAPAMLFASVLALAILLTVLGCRDDTESPAAPEPGPALATTAQVLSFSQVSAGAYHTCGVTTDDRAYCWGSNSLGQLGNGEYGSRSTPVAVAGGLRFVQVSAGYEHTCGVTTDDRAYCWGYNDFGQLGDSNQYSIQRTPVAVADGHHFRQIRAGSFHTCAVTPFDVAFCWGWNGRGQLGTNGGVHITPARVFGGLRFRRIVAGGLHTCGATTDDRGYCWGDNTFGQLGDGTHINRSRPVAVLGGLSFQQVGAGGSVFGDAQWREPNSGHSCGVTTDNLAYCWGDGFEGQVGDGKQTTHVTPVAVAGGRHFRGVSPGSYHTCAVTPADVAFCWGYNAYGALGNGTTSSSSTPVRVLGGLHFSGMSTGVVGFHSCGVTTDHRVYCWGYNSDGQLGDGTQYNTRLTPVAVAGAI